MKKTFLAITLILLLFVLSSCVNAIDPPFNLNDNLNTTWKSNDIDIYFKIDESVAHKNIGQISIENNTTVFYMLFDYGKNVIFVDKEKIDQYEDLDEAILFEGSYKFTDDKLIIKIKKNNFQDKNIKKISFFKCDDVAIKDEN